MMDIQLKNQIVREAKNYLAKKEMSQANFSRYCGVGESYLSNILNEKYEYGASAINDRYFEQIARSIGMSLAVAYWRTVETPQFIEVIAALEDAKQRGVTKMIIGQTGCGKTYATGKFVENNPVHTYKITVSSMHKIHDVLNDLGALLGVKLLYEHRKAMRMTAVIQKLRDIYMQGGRPQVIIDEAENLTNGMIGLTKGLYDGLNKFASLVLIGTDELEVKLDKMERYGYNYPGIPQFRRRFKAGTVHLTPIDKVAHFEAFLEEIDDMNLRRMLRELCNNYGELNDFLEPALKSAAEDGVPLTDQYFKTMYKIA